MNFDITSFKNENKLPAHKLYENDLAVAKSAGVFMPQLMPYFNRHSKVGVLLIHGFSASPHEMSILTSLLEDSNFTVYNVRIDGHGTSIDNLNKTTFEAWYSSLSNGYLALRDVCEKIVVVGQSMGGLLAHLVATFNDVNLLLLLAPAYKMNNSFAPLSKYLRYLVKYIPRSLDDEEKKYYYNGFGVAGIYQIIRLEDFILNAGIPLNMKTFLFVSENDVLISRKFAVEQVNKFAKDREIIVLNNKEYNVNHILTKDNNMEAMKLVVEAIKTNQ